MSFQAHALVEDNLVARPPACHLPVEAQLDEQFVAEEDCLAGVRLLRRLVTIEMPGWCRLCVLVECGEGTVSAPAADNHIHVTYRGTIGLDTLRKCMNW